VEAVPTDGEVTQGSEACWVATCRSLGGLTCHYVDDAGGICSTAWCPDHRVMIDGRPYCRRHGALVPTLQEGMPLPAFTDRSANMVNRVAELLHQAVCFVLASEGGNVADLDVATTPTRISAYSGGKPVWGRSWALMNGQGRVLLEVEARASATLGDRLEVLVSGAIVYEQTPVWDALRREGSEESQRAFIGDVVKGVRKATREAVLPR
jgi:hypothetical protein